MDNQADLEKIIIDLMQLAFDVDLIEKDCNYSIYYWVEMKKDWWVAFVYDTVYNIKDDFFCVKSWIKPESNIKMWIWHDRFDTLEEVVSYFFSRVGQKDEEFYLYINKFIIDNI